MTSRERFTQFMSWFETPLEIAKAIAHTMRAPERPAKASINQIVDALERIAPSQFLDYQSADINTVARLHSLTPFGYSSHQFRSAIMLEPGRAFGLANDLVCPALENFCLTKELGVLTLDIRKITCLSASKGPLARSKTLDDFAIAECRAEIGTADLNQLEACLRYPGVRLASSFRQDGDALKAISWNGGKVYWPNHDGLHHFAAARYIAGVLNLPVSITASMTSCSISEHAVTSLELDYYLWVIPDDESSWTAIRLIQRWGINIGVAGMPLPYLNDLLILLPKQSPDAATLAEIITASGMTLFSVFTSNWLTEQARAFEITPTWFGD